MASTLKRTALRPVPYLLSDWVGQKITKLFTRKLKKQFYDEVTDDFLTFLLKGMDLAFCLSKGYRRNIRAFESQYLFATADRSVAVTAIFKNGNMKVDERMSNDWTMRVTFKNAKALMEFLFSKDQDILKSILANDVEVDGNLNYIYKFGFLARDLFHRLGIEF